MFDLNTLFGTLYLGISLGIIAVLLFSLFFFIIKRKALAKLNVAFIALDTLILLAGIAACVCAIMLSVGLGITFLPVELTDILTNIVGMALAIGITVLSVVVFIVLLVRCPKAKTVDEAVIVSEEQPVAVEEQIAEEFIEEDVSFEIEAEAAVTEEIADETVVDEVAITVSEEIKEEKSVVITAMPPKEKIVSASPFAKPVAPDAPVELVLKYRRSFKAKLIQAPDNVKEYYSKIKSELFAYKGVKSRNSWSSETIYKGRVKLIVFRFKGKRLEVCYALPVESLEDSKYKGKDVSKKKSLIAVPFGYCVTSARKAKYSLELANMVVADKDYKKLEYKYLDPVFELPYEDDLTLLEKKLLKESWVKKGGRGKPSSGSGAVAGELPETSVEAELAVTEIIIPTESYQQSDAIKLVSDDTAFNAIKREASYVDKTKQVIINIGTLNDNFNDGDKVTLKDMINKGLVSKNATYVKILAGGNISKKLIIIANDFSLDAVKMLLLKEGEAILLGAKSAE